MAFTTAEGYRKNSLVYIYENCMFVKIRESEKTIFLRCARRDLKCPVTAQISKYSHLLFPGGGQHLHKVDEADVKVLDLTCRLKRKAEKSSCGLRELFNTMTRDSEVGNRISFIKMESCLTKRRKVCQPRIPQNMTEATDMLANIECDRFSQFYKGAIQVDGETALMFASEKILRLLNAINVRAIHVDGTFKVCPSFITQLLTVFFVYKEHTIPAFHFLVTSKRRCIYDGIISKIMSKVPNLNPSSIQSDFEPALQEAWSVNFKEANVQGCWFHFCQALWRYLQKLSLCVTFFKVKEFRKWVHMFMCLALLPPQCIEGIFHYLWKLFQQHKYGLTYICLVTYLAGARHSSCIMVSWD